MADGGKNFTQRTATRGRRGPYIGGNPSGQPVGALVDFVKRFAAKKMVRAEYGIDILETV